MVQFHGRSRTVRRQTPPERAEQQIQPQAPMQRPAVIGARHYRRYPAAWMATLLAQLAQLGGGFANFAGNAPSQLNGLAAISGRFARVVATKAIPFCSWI
jgi:cytochrome c oxidase assembly factor CtaG